MFFHFFNEYKMEIYNKRVPGWKKMSWGNWLVLVGVLTAGYLPMGLRIFIQISGVPLLIITIVCTAAITIIGRMAMKKLDSDVGRERNTLVSQYQTNTIQAVVRLLKDPKYNMYHAKSIIWLMNECAKKTSKDLLTKAKNSALFTAGGGIVSAAATAVFDMVSKTSSFEFFITFICLAAIIVLVGIVLWYGGQWLISFASRDDKKPYRALKEELEYILTLLPQEQGADSVHKRICPKCPKVRKKAH